MKARGKKKNKKINKIPGTFMLPYMEEQKKTKEDNVKNVADANTDVTHKPLAYFIFKTNKNKY